MLHLEKLFASARSTILGNAGLFLNFCPIVPLTSERSTQDVAQWFGAIEKLVLDKMDLKRPEAYRIKPTEVTNEDEVISFEDSEVFEVTDTSEVKKVNQPETIKYIDYRWQKR